MNITPEQWIIISMALPSLLGGLKVLSRLTTNTWDDKIVDGMLKIFTVFTAKKP